MKHWIISIAALTFCSSLVAAQLSPPRYIFQAQMQVSIGADICVHVDDLQRDDLGQAYLLNVHEICGDDDKAQALSDLLTMKHDLSGDVVIVQVLNFKEEIIKPRDFPTVKEDAMKVIKLALTGNPYFIDLLSGNHYYSFFIEFRKMVLQYYADSQADKFQNRNQVAADVFLLMLNLDSGKALNIGVTTSRE